MSETNVRWKSARNALGLKQAELADKLGISRPTVSLYENDAAIPLGSIRAFSAICGVRESYLLNGDLPILEPPSAQTAVQRIVQELNLPDICAAAMEEWLLLSEDEQAVIKRAIQATIDRHAAQHPPDDPEPAK